MITILRLALFLVRRTVKCLRVLSRRIRGLSRSVALNLDGFERMISNLFSLFARLTRKTAGQPRVSVHQHSGDCWWDNMANTSSPEWRHLGTVDRFRWWQAFCDTKHDDISSHSIYFHSLWIRHTTCRQQTVRRIYKQSKAHIKSITFYEQHISMLHSVLCDLLSTKSTTNRSSGVLVRRNATHTIRWKATTEWNQTENAIINVIVSII